MRKIQYITFAVMATAAALTSCQKGMVEPENVNDVSIYAYDASTKATLNSDWTESWTSSDHLTVFNAAAGSTTFSDNCRFLISGTPSEGKFVKDADQTDKSLVSGQSSYDWYACYPWMEYAPAPGGTKGYTVAMAPVQVGYNSSAHIAPYDILAGKALAVAEGTAPSIAMTHVCTLLKFTVVNKTGEATTITGLTVDATEGGSYITGSFTMDWGDAGSAPSLDPLQMGSSKSYLASLSVKENVGTEDQPDYQPITATVANGESVDIYMVTAPFTIPAGKSIKLTISGGKGDLVVKKTFTSAISFAAGSYNTATLSYEQPEYVVFTESFGANTVATSNVPGYGKAGLTTAVPGHADNYTYAVTGNSSFALSTTTNGKINNPDWISYLEGAAVKIVATPATSANSAAYIKNVTVEENTTYVFKYNKTRGKVDGAEFQTRTVFKYRQSGTTDWTTVNETAAAGLITQEFTTGGYTSLDIGVEALDRIPSGTVNYYPAVDLFRLIRK